MHGIGHYVISLLNFVLHVSSLRKSKVLLTLGDIVAQYWILLDDSNWEIQFSDSQRNGFGQEQWFSISNSPQGALSFCSSLSLHLVDSIVLFSEQWNGLSSSSVLSGVFVLWNKWTDGSQTSNGSRKLGVCVCVCVCLLICMKICEPACVCMCVLTYVRGVYIYVYVDLFVFRPVQ